MNMNTASQSLHWLTKKNLLALIFGAVLLYLLVTVMVDQRLQDHEYNVRLLIADQESTLIAIAETTARNGADAVTESIVQDCNITEREEFDSLLGRLNSGLARSELQTLERLFGRCGSFYSDRKTVMVSRLAREIEVFESYVSLLSLISGKDIAPEMKVAEWQALAAEERQQSELFAQLVRIQDEIITLLLAGESTASPGMEEVLRSARETQEGLLYASKQSQRIRAELIPL